MNQPETASPSVSSAVASAPSAATRDAAGEPSWTTLVEPYRHADTRMALFQLLTTLALLLASEIAAVQMLETHPVVAAVFVVLAAGFLVRVFIFQHDCGHGSFLPKQSWNDAVGLFCSFLMMTPYFAWQRDHALHHATTGDLDRRGTGDVMTVTVAEYRAMSPLMRLGYTAFRNPFVMFFGGAILLFTILQRIPGQYLKGQNMTPKERLNIHVTSVVSGLLLLAIGLVFGWRTLLLVHLPAAMLAGSGGIFLFYCQHQYPQAYWRRHGEWDFLSASILGSSYLKLPKVLQYFSGNIGIHHIHHLAPKVPNYKLQRCYDDNPFFQKDVVTFGFLAGVRTIALKVYDEEHRRMITWRELRALETVPAEAARSATAPAE